MLFISEVLFNHSVMFEMFTPFPCYPWMAGIAAALVGKGTIAVTDDSGKEISIIITSTTSMTPTVTSMVTSMMSTPAAAASAAATPMPSAFGIAIKRKK
jgi:hypothetical protein